MIGADSMQPGGAETLTPGVISLVVPAVLGQQGLAHFRAAVLDASISDSTRVIILRGGAEVFCRGLDFAEIVPGIAATEPPAWERATQDYTEVISALREAKAITIAIVEGPALGGGVGLAAACDFVVATEAATFALPELLLGLVPAIILPVLAQRIGLHPAKRWAMTQATWKAAEANTAGLVDQLVSVKRLDQELQRLVRNLLRCHPRGVAALKGLVREIHGMDVASAISLGRETLNALLGNIQVRTDLVAFRDYGLLPGEAGA